MRIKFGMLGLPLLLSLAACATPTPPTMDGDDLLAADLIFNSAGGLAGTSLGNMPSGGMATYSGQISSLASATSGIIADMEMTIDFSSATITGQASNINILAEDSNDFESQLLGGVLTISNGAVSGTSMTADLNGALSGAARGFAITFNTNFDLAGNFMSSNPGVADANIIQGEATGTMRVGALGRSETIDFTSGEVGFVVCTTACGPLMSP